MTATFRSIWR